MPDILKNLVNNAAALYSRRHLLSAEDMSAEEIEAIFKVAEYFLEQGINGRKRYDYLRGLTIVSAFFESSTRTKLSFEIAARRLGADLASFQTTASSIAKGESLLDTLATIDAMGVDMWIVRHSHSGAVDLMSRNSNNIFINAGDGRRQHPTQGLLDSFTLWRKWKGGVRGKKITIIGDIEHSRVARSNFSLLQALGCEIAIVSPGVLCPRSWQSFGVRRLQSSKEALAWSDAIMLLRLQKERMESGLLPGGDEYAKYFGLNNRALRNYPNIVIMHPGPANYNAEIDEAASASSQSVIREQVTNGVAIRMAVLAILAFKMRNNTSA